MLRIFPRRENEERTAVFCAINAIANSRNARSEYLSFSQSRQSGICMPKSARGIVISHSMFARGANRLLKCPSRCANRIARVFGRCWRVKIAVASGDYLFEACNVPTGAKVKTLVIASAVSSVRKIPTDCRRALYATANYSRVTTREIAHWRDQSGKSHVAK